MRRWLACGLAAALGAAALTGCTLITDSFLTNEFSGDPFPVHVVQLAGIASRAATSFADLLVKRLR